MGLNQPEQPSGKTGPKQYNKKINNKKSIWNKQAWKNVKRSTQTMTADKIHSCNIWAEVAILDNKKMWCFSISQKHKTDFTSEWYRIDSCIWNAILQNQTHCRLKRKNLIFKKPYKSYRCQQHFFHIQIPL